MSADTYSKWEHQFNNNGDMRLTLLTVSIHWWTPNFIQFFALVKAQCLRGKHSSKPQGCCSQSSFQHVTWPGKVWNSRPVFIPKNISGLHKVEKLRCQKFGILKYTSSPGSKHHNYPMLSTNHISWGSASRCGNSLCCPPIASNYAIYLSICLSVCLSIYLSFYLSIYLPIYMYIYICMHIYNVYVYIYISDVRGCWHPRVRQCQHRTHN